MIEQQDPRYRIWNCPENASFEDLLAVLISHGFAGRSVMDLSRDLARLAGSESGLFELEASRLTAIKGLGKAKATVILAALELGRRKSIQNLRSGVKFDPKKTALWFHERLQGLGNEYFYLVTLNRGFSVIEYYLLNRGNPDRVEVYYRDILKVILDDRASYCLIAHNHPEESASPSRADLENLTYLESLIAPLGVRLLDQYIAGNNGVYSCNQSCYLVETQNSA